MGDINQDFLFPIWGSEITDCKIDVIHHAMHFTLSAADDKGEVHTQIDIYNIRMFCYGHDACYHKEDPRHYFASPGYKEEPYPESFHDGTWLEMTEIETAKPGQANVKVYFNYSENVPSPYFNADQNIVIDFPNAVLTVAAEKIVVNGKRFIWSQEQGTFVPEESGRPGKREETYF